MDSSAALETIGPVESSVPMRPVAQFLQRLRQLGFLHVALRNPHAAPDDGRVMHLFRNRIELRQIGVRDEAKMLGGYGSCGRPLCCTTWLQTFEPISIKMAKQQNLSLNPSKLSGMCGRLKCCLRYELPNGKGVVHGGCADEGGCGSCDNPTGPGSTGCGSCGSGGCGKCG